MEGVQSVHAGNNSNIGVDFVKSVENVGESKKLCGKSADTISEQNANTSPCKSNDNHIDNLETKNDDSVSISSDDLISDCEPVPLNDPVPCNVLKVDNFSECQQKTISTGDASISQQETSMKESQKNIEGGKPLCDSREADDLESIPDNDSVISNVSELVNIHISKALVESNTKNHRMKERTKLQSHPKWREIELNSDEDPGPTVLVKSTLNKMSESNKTSDQLIENVAHRDVTRVSTILVTSSTTTLTPSTTTLTSSTTTPTSSATQSTPASTTLKPLSKNLHVAVNVASTSSATRQLSVQDPKEVHNGDDVENNDDDDDEDDDNDDDEDDDDNDAGESRASRIEEMKKKLAVEKLHFLVEKLNKKICRLEEHELTLDDMKDDSVYTQLELYKKKFVIVWKKLCELTNQSASTGRETEKPFLFKGTNYPQINKAISRFFNKYQTFPDYQDIHDIVSTCNDFFKLKLNKQMLSALSASAFTSVGKALKNRRIRDYKENFGSHLIDQSDSKKDPALDDPELKKKLDDNKRKADSNMEKTFHHFETLPARESDDSDDKSDEEDDEESESTKDTSKHSSQNLKSVDDDVKKNVQLNSSDDDNMEPRLEKIVAMEIDAIEIDSASEDSSLSKDNGMKKSLSTLFDAQRLRPEKKNDKESNDSSGSEDSGENIKSMKNNKSIQIKHIESKRNSSSQGSTRSLRSNGASQKGGSENLRSSKRIAESSDSCSSKNMKKQKVSEEKMTVSSESRPIFIRLWDEIPKRTPSKSSSKMESGNINSMIAHISKALTPSKVVLTNCMSCKVVCRKSCMTDLSEIINAANIGNKQTSFENNDKSPPKKLKLSHDSTKQVEKRASQKKIETTKPATKGKCLEEGDEKLHPESKEEYPSTGKKEGLLSDHKDGSSTPCSDLGQCVALSDSEESGADDKKKKEEAVFSVFGKVIGEVLSFQEYEDNETIEDEGLVKNVTSLGKDHRLKMEDKKDEDENIPKISNSLNFSSPTEVVNVDLDSKNEDGIIFVGAYKTSSAMRTSNNPHSSTQTTHPSRNCPTISTNAQTSGVIQSSSWHSNSGKTIILGQRRKAATHDLPSSAQKTNSRTFTINKKITPLSTCASISVPNNLVSLSSAGNFSETGSDLMANLFDPSVPVSDIVVPRLPAKVLRRINNITKKITGNNRGMGRVNNNLKAKPFQGFVPKHHPRSNLLAGGGYMIASANMTAKARQKMYGHLGEPQETMEPPVVQNPNIHKVQPSFLNNKKRIPGKSLLRNNNRFFPYPRIGNPAISRDQLPDTVVIDDDDSFLPTKVQRPNHLQREAECMRICKKASKELEASRPKNAIKRNLNFGMNESPSSIGKFVTSQQLKFQQKTQSSDSDIILCEVEFNSQESIEARETTHPAPGNLEKSLETGNSLQENLEGRGDVGSCRIGVDGTNTVAFDSSGSVASRREESVVKPAAGRSATSGVVDQASLTRGLRIKTMSSDSDVILCEESVEPDDRERDFVRSQLSSYVKDNMVRLVSDLQQSFPSQEADSSPGTNPPQSSVIAGSSMTISNDTDSIILLD